MQEARGDFEIESATVEAEAFSEGIHRGHLQRHPLLYYVALWNMISKGYRLGLTHFEVSRPLGLR